MSEFAAIPTLTTARLRLRGHRLADADASAAMQADAQVMAFISGSPVNREDAWVKMLRYAGLWQHLGYGYWLVETHDGRFVGEVGFADFRRAMAPSIEGEPEMGWVLARWAHGQGYAREAVEAGLAWMDQTHRPPSTCCIINPDNALSFALAHKVGYDAVAMSDYKGGPIIVLRRPAPALSG
jgi:RimJ/RimL family protein N-acetyltransferase